MYRVCFFPLLLEHLVIVTPVLQFFIDYPARIHSPTDMPSCTASAVNSLCCSLSNKIFVRTSNIATYTVTCYFLPLKPPCLSRFAYGIKIVFTVKQEYRKSYFVRLHHHSEPDSAEKHCLLPRYQHRNRRKKTGIW